ncbi:MAG: SDR family NAD(P)-dependent oxidoreductase, partial [Saezia sp.]
MSKLVYITGASSGIGQALAKQYLLLGDRVVMIARREQEMQHWCEQEGFSQEHCFIYKADVRDVDAITSVGRQCMDEVGVPDVVIASAGVSIGVDTEILSDIEVMRKLYET